MPKGAIGRFSGRAPPVCYRIPELMNQRTATSVDTASVYLPPMLLLFVGSGCAALIYEVVWFQLLQLVIGSSAVSLGVLLGTFMGGMCLGSFVLPRYIARGAPSAAGLRVSRTRHRRLGLLLLFGMPLVNSIYAGIGGGQHLLRGIVARICLLPPTLLMGATLPAIARWVRDDARGRLVARLLLRRQHRRRGDRQPARGLLPAARLRHGHRDVRRRRAQRARRRCSACSSPIASRLRADREPIGDRRPVRARRRRHARSTSPLRLSGMTALWPRRCVWTRLLSLLFGATIYTFSLILAVFLFGLGIGSSVGSAIARSTVERPRVALGWCQMLHRARAMAWAALHADRVAAVLADQPVDHAPSIWYNFQLDLVRCALGRAAGADSLGRELSAGARRGRQARPGPRAARRRRLRREHGRRDRRVARARAWCSRTGLGTQHAQQVLIVVSAIVGAAAARAGGWRATPAQTGMPLGAWPSRSSWRRRWPVARRATVPTIPGILVAYGRYAATWVGRRRTSSTSAKA